MGTALLAIGERVRRTARNFLPRSIYSRSAEVCNSFWGVRRLGLTTYNQLSAMRCKSAAGHAPTAVQLRPLLHPFYIRPGTSDAGEVVHSVVREVYGYKFPPGHVRLIIDAGANIGDTTVWYANRFPKAQIIAIEPDPENFDVLARNCAPYDGRIVLVRAALWPVRMPLALKHADVQSGISVAMLCDAASAACVGIDPFYLLQQIGHRTIDIFKIDIEGAELQLFRGDCDVWLRRTRSIVIEIHTPEARAAVLAATARNGFRHAVYRDVNVFERYSSESE